MHLSLSSLIALSIALGAAQAVAEEGATLSLSALPSDAELARRLWERGPELAEARARWAAAAADADRSHLLPNPSLDFTWGTIPVGITNPPGLVAPLAHVPNYGVGLSVLLEVGKRGPRQDATHEAAVAAARDAEQLLREGLVELLDHLGALAEAEVRIATLESLERDSARLTDLQRERTKHGDAAGLDAARAALEEEKLHISLQEAQSAIASELLACSRAIGAPCEPFGSAERADAFLERGAPAAPSLDERPDLRSLAAQERAAQASLRLARAQAVPDPTLRVAYLRDQFVISGNQLNSLSVGLSFPLPLFDHGQTDAAAAQARAHAAATERLRLRSQAERDLAQLETQAHVLEQRQQALRNRALPLAREVVTRLEGAVQQGGAPVTELLLARRTLGELLINDAAVELQQFRLALARRRVAGTPLPPPSDWSAAQ